MMFHDISISKKTTTRVQTTLPKPAGIVAHANNLAIEVLEN